MRAKEFTINIPITIHLNDDGEPEISTGQEPVSSADLDQNPVMVPPLQQGLELAKATLGKESPVINKLTQTEPDLGKEEDDTTGIDLERIKQLISPSP